MVPEPDESKKTASIKDAALQQEAFAKERINTDENGRETVTSEGDQGGFFVPGASKPSQQAQPTTPTTSPAQNSLNIQNIGQPANSPPNDNQARIAQLQQEIEDLKSQDDNGSAIEQTPAPQPETPQQPAPVITQQAPPTTTSTPMFGADIPQEQPTSQNKATQQPPQQQQQIQQPQQQPAQQSYNPADELNPAIRDALKPQQDPNLQTQVYIGQGQQGLALVLDGLTQKDMDRYSLMAEYLHEKYPESVPVVHPAVVVKFALNHLLITIRTNIAKDVECANCQTTFPKLNTHCPGCGAVNACPTCGKLIGYSKLSL